MSELNLDTPPQENHSTHSFYLQKYPNPVHTYPHPTQTTVVPEQTEYLHLHSESTPAPKLWSSLTPIASTIHLPSSTLRKRYISAHLGAGARKGLRIQGSL